ncbi:MAG: glyoxylate/hydroxypyruvate reductase A [Pseudomonadota bacterium]
MALLFLSEADPVEPWRAALLAEMPDLDIRVWPDQVGDPGDIDVAFVWKPPPGELARYPNLRAILSLGAGIDALIQDDTLPDLPLARMVDPSMTSTMADYILLSVLRHHRHFDLFEREQRAGRWTFVLPKRPEERTVGILGLGELGAAAATRLLDHGFNVRGWSRSKKTIKGVQSFHGQGQLDNFLEAAEILVCLLPLTADTEGILNAALFAALPKGACLINAARGGHLKEIDLLDALENGQLSAATLDVFETEPPPATSPLWLHERVLMTPHVASYCSPQTAAKGVVENIKRALSGKPLRNLVDRNRGY